MDCVPSLTLELPHAGKDQKEKKNLNLPRLLRWHGKAGREVGVKESHMVMNIFHFLTADK